MMRKILLSSLLITALSGCEGLWLGDEKKEKLPGERIRVDGMYSDARPSVTGKLDVSIPTANSPRALVSSAGIYDGTYYNVAIKEDFKQVRAISFASNSDLVSITMPVITSDMIYAQGTNGEIIAYSRASGSKVWAVPAFKGKENLGLMTFSSVYQQGGMSISDEVIFATSGSDSVIAFNAKSGERIWEIQLPSTTRSAPVVSGKLAIIQTIGDDIYALDVKTGEIVWTYLGVKSDVQVLNTVSPIVSGSSIIFQNSGGEIIALDSSSGSEIWSVNLSSALEKLTISHQISDNVKQPVLDGGYIFAVGNDGSVYAIDVKQGKLSWRQPLNASRTVTLGGELLFTLNSDNQLVAISKHSGEVRWLESLPSSESTEAWSQPAVINGKVVTVSSKGRWVGLNFNSGKVEQELKLADSVLLPPKVVGESLYLFSSRSKLVEYK